MKVYIVINNNQLEYEDYEEWVDGVYATEKDALERKQEILRGYGLSVEPKKWEPLDGVPGLESYGYAPIRIEIHEVEGLQ